MLFACGGKLDRATVDSGAAGEQSDAGGGGAESNGTSSASGGYVVVTLPEPATLEECDAVDYPGHFGYEHSSFADTLAKLRAHDGSGPTRIDVFGMVNTWALSCFDGLADPVYIRDCPDPFDLANLPSGVTGAFVSNDCQPYNIEGLRGVAEVAISDPSLVEDFEPLSESTSLGLGGYVDSSRVIPHILSATQLALAVHADNLSDLNQSLVQTLYLRVTGLADLSSYVPNSALTCFDIVLEDLPLSESNLEVQSRVCAPGRDGYQCDNHNGCFEDYRWE